MSLSFEFLSKTQNSKLVTDMPFTGFTTETLVGLPPELFSEVLPQITLPSELKVTLHVFYRMSRQRGAAPRRVSWDELAADKTLRRSLRAISKLRLPEDLLAEGLEAAVRRTSLLHRAARRWAGGQLVCGQHHHQPAVGRADRAGRRGAGAQHRAARGAADADHAV